MNVLHVCSPDAVPMRNIIRTYQRYAVDINIDISLTGKVEKDYDIVHGHYCLTKNTIKAGRQARRKGIPFVLHCHGSDIRRIESDGARNLPIHHRIYSSITRRRADKVLLSTPDLLEWSAGTYIPNPVDLKLFRPLEVKKSERILLFGRFAGEQRILKLIDSDRVYDCVNWGTEIEFPKNVNILDFVAHEELPKLFNNYKSMIGALRDPVSLGRLEAMACGLRTYTDFPEKYTIYYGFENPDQIDEPREFVERYHHPEKIIKILKVIYQDLI